LRFLLGAPFLFVRRIRVPLVKRNELSGMTLTENDTDCNTEATIAQSGLTADVLYTSKYAYHNTRDWFLRWACWSMQNAQL
jgi:hypothetical protein